MCTESLVFSSQVISRNLKMRWRSYRWLKREGQCILHKRTMAFTSVVHGRPCNNDKRSCRPICSTINLTVESRPTYWHYYFICLISFLVVMANITLKRICKCYKWHFKLNYVLFNCRNIFNWEFVDRWWKTNEQLHSYDMTMQYCWCS